ncbi:hypothetical protein S40285_07987 [Stachybotrys chlorohalonatus IBT 40285]|uniref:Arrestin C-terminal-like domain-containing protein n=1 Tax=Stachybotrys chlorohalonatus (strain IBT 40285) TaxID=1283841 RepID=A0A084QJH2_STAC4|nr:hypothetical protein S40285_07987 [Stachybotrys chlorohalonata IBT 40285]
MPSFNPFSNVTGRNACTLFDIRLENDFIVFRGNENESAAQLLKGVVVLCLPSALRIEDVHLRLIGTLRVTSTGTTGQRVDKNTTILEHRWAPFVGVHGKSTTLPAGNYEYPFEYMFPGDSAESVEGIPEAAITYRLKATVGRGKLAYDLHAYKHLRLIRTLEPGALEYVHAMSVENIWPNKIEYSIVIPRKAVVFGGHVDVEMRFTPLLKGLELGDITIQMDESRETRLRSQTGHVLREHKINREVSTWKFEVTREECWRDTIEDTGQEGWVMTKKLNLPKKLVQCTQDVHMHGIKIRHKMKLTLRAALPISIFISPNMVLDEQGNPVNPTPSGAQVEQEGGGALAPPGYGEHVLDQLYDEVDISGYQTPGMQTPGFGTPGFQSPRVRSGFSSPLYSHSRAGSAENLAAMGDSVTITPADLSSRLANVSLDPAQRNASYTSMRALSSGINSGMASPTVAHQGVHVTRSEPPSGLRTRSNSGDGQSGRNSPEHIEIDMEDLSRVPSYQTAVRTPARSQTRSDTNALPDYVTALSAPRTPPAAEGSSESLTTITEGVTSNYYGTDMARPLHSSTNRHSAEHVQV